MARAGSHHPAVTTIKAGACSQLACLVAHCPAAVAIAHLRMVAAVFLSAFPS